jgi:PIN domain nuclease of toxin-antitoxin system
MLLSKRRLRVDQEPLAFIQTLLDARGYIVQPITPEIAARSQSPEMPQRDPADRLIAATALVSNSELLSADEVMKKVPGLRVVW